MSDDTLQLISNSKEINQMFLDLANRVKNPKPALREISQLMQDYIDDAFETEGKSLGEKWQDWSDKYKEYRTKIHRGQGKILSLNNELRESITDKITNTSVEVGTNKIYARVHNEGAEIKKRNGEGTFEMPQRTYMKWTLQLEQLVADEFWATLKIQDYIDKENAKIRFLKGE